MISNHIGLKLMQIKVGRDIKEVYNGRIHDIKRNY